MYDHTINTCVLAIVFSKWKKLDYETTINLGTAALLHDIGEAKLDTKIIGMNPEQDNHVFKQPPSMSVFQYSYFQQRPTKTLYSASRP
ncbi:MAG: hypothetical protein OEY29_00275 [Gammaproteobacteria bacterium]|nr:hypothetical protein [Gammaproteobacteria bacterium]